MNNEQFFSLANKALAILEEIERKLIDARKSHEAAVRSSAVKAAA